MAKVFAAPHSGYMPVPLRSMFTPPVGATNGGVIMRGGPVIAIHDPLAIRCLVLDDGKTQLAIVVCDLRMIERRIVERARELASAELAWAKNNLLISATHTHAALDWRESPAVKRIAGMRVRRDADRRRGSIRMPLNDHG